VLIIATASAHGSVKIQLRDGRPIVDGVYVNGHGPYRFLLDTGANLNLIDTRLAHKIGLTETSHVELGSAAGTTSVAQSDDNEIVLDTASAAGQRFLISTLDAIHNSSPDVQGVLGTWFLLRFDFGFDLQSRTLTFTAPPPSSDSDGVRVEFHLVNLRPVVSSSLGDLELDSASNQLILYGIRPDDVQSSYQLHTVAGFQVVGKSHDKQLAVAGKRVWRGDAVAMPNRPEAGIDGLLPLNLFKSIYICNSGGYIIFR
jgi:hypothetical protein